MIAVKVYTMQSCPACESVKGFLNKQGFEYTEVLLDRDITRDELKSLFPGTKTVPVTLINGKVYRDSTEAIKELSKLMNGELL